MTFFLHIPEVEQGISEANKAFGAVDEGDAE